MREVSPKGRRGTLRPQGADRKQENSAQDHVGSLAEGEPTYLVIGKLRRPHGVKGEMIMEVLTDFPQRLRQGKKVFLGPNHSPQIIRSIRNRDQFILIAFKDYEDCDQVGVLRNLEVFIEAHNLPELPDGEFYYHQLIGLQVVDENGNQLGRLVEILETGANDVYLVRDEAGKELLLPAIEDVIREVSLARGELVVRPPEWL